VNKEVFFRVFSFDETKSFGLVKPFYATCFHIAIIQKNTMYKPLIERKEEKMTKNQA
jgi:hypothetical protein